MSSVRAGDHGEAGDLPVPGAVRAVRQRGGLPQQPDQPHPREGHHHALPDALTQFHIIIVMHNANSIKEKGRIRLRSYVIAIL